MQAPQESKDIPFKEFPRPSALESPQPSKERQEEPKPKEVNKDKDMEISQRKGTTTSTSDKSNGSVNSREQKAGLGKAESKFQNAVSKGKEWMDQSNVDSFRLVASLAAVSAVLIFVAYAIYNYVY